MSFWVAEGWVETASVSRGLANSTTGAIGVVGPALMLEEFEVSGENVMLGTLHGAEEGLDVSVFMPNRIYVEQKVNRLKINGVL